MLVSVNDALRKLTYSDCKCKKGRFWPPFLLLMKKAFAFLLLLSLQGICSCTVIRTDTHGHIDKFSQLQKSKERKKMIRSKGYNPNSRKRGGGGYERYFKPKKGRKF